MVSRQNNVRAARVFGSFLLVASLYTMGGISPANASFASQQTAHGFTSQQQQFDWLAPTDGNATTAPIGQTPTSWGGFDGPNADDPIIPSSQLAPKGDIKNALKVYSAIPLVAYQAGVAGTPGVPAVPAQGTPGTAGYVPGVPAVPAIPAVPATPASPTAQELSLINTYTAVFDTDIAVPADPYYNTAGIILDASQYYQAHGKTITATAPTPTSLCDSTNGCFLTVYLVANPTNVITAVPSGGTCPATASLNTQCLPYCSATVANCPGNFKYNTSVVYDSKVFAWNVISKADFQAFTIGISAPLYNIYTTLNANNILEVSVNTSQCTAEELAVNGNLCIKYYQFDPASQSLTDLYNPALGTNTANFNSTYALTPFGTAHAGTGIFGANGGGAGAAFPLNPGQTVDVQFKSLSGAVPINSSGIAFTLASGYPLAGEQLIHSQAVPANQINSSFAAFHIANGTNKKILIPSNSVGEFYSFLKTTVLDTSPQSTPATTVPSGVVTATPITGATTKYLKLTPWSGNAACPTATASEGAVTLTNYPCPASGVISAYWEGMWTYAYGNAVACSAGTIAAQERFCQASTGAYWQGGVGATSSCNICSTLSGYHFNLPTYQVGQTSGTAITGGVGNSGLVNDTTTAGGAAAQGCYVQVSCPSVVTWIGSASHCLAGDSHVAVPEDKVVLLSEVKAGDTVLGFDKLKGEIKPFKVKEVTVTQDEQTININRGHDPSHILALTANHSVVTGEGKTILASELKVGDTVLLASGEKVKVKNIGLSKDKGAVYNLKLDGGIGFIANGVRVLSVHEKAKQDDKL